MNHKNVFLFLGLSLLLAFLDIISKHIAFSYFPAIVFTPEYCFSMEKNKIKTTQEQYNFYALRSYFEQKGIQLSHHTQVNSFGSAEEVWIHDRENRYLLLEKEQEIHVYTSKEKIPASFFSSSPYLFVPLRHSKSIIPGFFDIKAAFNRGAMWSILQGQVTLLTAFSIIAIGFILFLVLKNSASRGYMVSLAFITSGAFGNLWDRIFFNGVRDFLDFYIGKYHWPTFNFADTFILIGIGLFMIIEWKFSPKNFTQK
ncbi:MAG: signal peptidase II [Candidatus Brocadiae bacterium]|nr:signal peptidase II [Candidatus Brocadiia bacterium]